MLAAGDYLLWNWSLNGNHDVLALVSGLTLPPLAIACIWLLALSVMRLLAHSVNRSRPRAGNVHEVRVSQGAREALASSSNGLGDEVEDDALRPLSPAEAALRSRGKLAA